MEEHFYLGGINLCVHKRGERRDECELSIYNKGSKVVVIVEGREAREREREWQAGALLKGRRTTSVLGRFDEAESRILRHFEFPTRTFSTATKKSSQVFRRLFFASRVQEPCNTIIRVMETLHKHAREPFLAGVPR